MGRAPCCDKTAVKKGPWSPEEDAVLKSYIEKHGTGGNWIALPLKIGLKRCGKSCRLRWLNYLRPNIKHGGFTEEEDYVICSLYMSIGSRWSIIASQLTGRTDNDIKNYWNTRLKKKLQGKTFRQETTTKPSVQTQHRIQTVNLDTLNQTLYNRADNSSFAMEGLANQNQERPIKKTNEEITWEPNKGSLDHAASRYYYGSSINTMDMIVSSSASLSSLSSSTNSSWQVPHFNFNDEQEIFAGFDNFLLDDISNSTTQEMTKNTSSMVERSTLAYQSNKADDISSILDYQSYNDVFSYRFEGYLA